MPIEPDAPVAAAMATPCPANDVVTELSYVLAGDGMPVCYACEPPQGVPWESARFHDVEVTIADARARRGASLHANGFELLDAPTAVCDFDDRAQVENIYYPEVLELALAATGGARGAVFDHLVRKRDPAQRTLGFGRQARGRPPTANGRVHNDYSEASGRRRLGLVLGERAAADVARFCIVNVWRSIAHPVLDTPLALCDSRGIEKEDAVVSQVRYPARTGEIYLFRHSPQHRWSYYPAMDRNEAVVFKQYDSQAAGVSRFTPHSAFDHPRVPPGTPPRQSIEARVLVVLG